MEKLPWIQWFPSDWENDAGIQSLPFHEQGIWLKLLHIMHGSERRGYLVVNNLRMTDEQIAKRLGISLKKWRNSKILLDQAGVCSYEKETGILFNRRMVRDEAKRIETMEKSRENGRLGGNPAFRKGHTNPYYHKPGDNPRDNPPHNPPGYLRDTPKITQHINSSLSESERERRKNLLSPHH